MVEERKDPELLAAVTLNIVCFRFNPGGLDEDVLNELNKELLMRMQEQEVAAPSYTVLNNQYAIRLHITDHRTRLKDLDRVVEQRLWIDKSLVNKNAHGR